MKLKIIKGILKDQFILNSLSKGRPQHPADRLNGGVPLSILYLQLFQPVHRVGSPDVFNLSAAEWINLKHILHGFVLSSCRMPHICLLRRIAKNQLRDCHIASGELYPTFFIFLVQLNFLTQGQIFSLTFRIGICAVQPPGIQIFLFSILIIGVFVTPCFLILCFSCF